jgi:hypothetical protein
VQIEAVDFLHLDDEARAVRAYQAGALDSVLVPESLLDEVQAEPALAEQLHTVGEGLTWLTRPPQTRPNRLLRISRPGAWTGMPSDRYCVRRDERISPITR